MATSAVSAVVVVVVVVVVVGLGVASAVVKRNTKQYKRIFLTRICSCVLMTFTLLFKVFNRSRRYWCSSSLRIAEVLAFRKTVEARAAAHVNTGEKSCLNIKVKSW